MSYPDIVRKVTRPVSVGSVTIGGGAAVSIQSMTNTRTADVDATLEQVRALTAAGADLVRLAVPTRDDTAALSKIVPACTVPIIADVHFHFERALEAIDAGVHKIRLNPGNISDRKQVSRVIAAAADAGVAIRIGVNEGSVIDKSGRDVSGSDRDRPLDELMAAKLTEYLEVFEEANFHNLVLSAKAHDAVTTIAVNRRLAERWDYPLHLGVTHAGTQQTGAIRSAAALGALLSEGIGDTIRISYAGDPITEVADALELLYSLRLRPRVGIELIACPTCGRIQTDIAPIAEQVRSELADVSEPLTVAIMGCVVNGPGEAENADVAICAGRGKAILYRRGRKVCTLTTEKIVPAIVAEVHSLLEEMDNMDNMGKKCEKD